MTYSRTKLEPPLGLKSPDAVRRRLCDLFGELPDTLGDPSRCYRMAVAIVLKQRYGTPTPPALFDLIDDAGQIGVHPDDLVGFIAHQFSLTPMRRFAA